MSRYRPSLPQLGDDLVLTDGGLETTLIFLRGIELREFAAIDLFRQPRGEAVLRSYYEEYISIARRYGVGVILETATWRASSDWGPRLGLDRAELAHANIRAVRLLEDLRYDHETESTPIVVSGCIGPRGDGYVPTTAMTPDEAEAYHSEQALTLTLAGADMLSALTMNYTEEALGIVRVAARAGMPVSISFTVETDGRLPTGESLRSAIERIDAETVSYPAYYMINCAHPEHFRHVLEEGAPWAERIRGIRANASCRSHAELNEATDLDIGDPEGLALEYAELRRRFPRLTVLGGCCGTDARHLEAIAAACAPLFTVAS